MHLSFRNGAANILLLFAAALVSLFIAEGIARLVFNPVDYLLPILEEDSLLDLRIQPGAGGHDQWGFRNNSVPTTVEIVAIGDSQTYGVSATTQESWPNLLSREMNATVYNMGLGGYGPLHYLYLLKNKALQLKPKIILVGLYFGNDFQDAFALAYGNPNWKTYRNFDLEDKLIPLATKDETVPEQPDDERMFGSFRTWMAGHSVVYRIVTQSIIGNAIRKQEVSADSSKVKFKVNEADTTYFSPSVRAPVLNPGLLEIQEGVRISLRAISEMQKICTNNNIRMLVVLIPTKEMVYSATVLNDGEFGEKEIFQAQIKYETQQRKNINTFLASENIELVDVLPVLSQSAREKIIYPFNDDHPNGDGYSIIAKKISNQLGQLQ